jgi:hypothetical protein
MTHVFIIVGDGAEHGPSRPHELPSLLFPVGQPVLPPDRLGIALPAHGTAAQLPHLPALGPLCADSEYWRLPAAGRLPTDGEHPSLPAGPAQLPHDEHWLFRPVNVVSTGFNLQEPEAIARLCSSPMLQVLFLFGQNLTAPSPTIPRAKIPTTT